jgi:hypothetical protein
MAVGTPPTARLMPSDRQTDALHFIPMLRAIMLSFCIPMFILLKFLTNPGMLQTDRWMDRWSEKFTWRNHLDNYNGDKNLEFLGANFLRSGQEEGKNFCKF